MSWLSHTSPDVKAASLAIEDLLTPIAGRRSRVTCTTDGAQKDFLVEITGRHSGEGLTLANLGDAMQCLEGISSVPAIQLEEDRSRYRLYSIIPIEQNGGLMGIADRVRDAIADRDAKENGGSYLAKADRKLASQAAQAVSSLFSIDEYPESNQSQNGIRHSFVGTGSTLSAVSADFVTGEIQFTLTTQHRFHSRVITDALQDAGLAIRDTDIEGTIHTFVIDANNEKNKGFDGVIRKIAALRRTLGAPSHAPGQGHGGGDHAR